MKLEKHIPTVELYDVENLQYEKIWKINALRFEKYAPPKQYILWLWLLIIGIADFNCNRSDAGRQCKVWYFQRYFGIQLHTPKISRINSY